MFKSPLRYPGGKNKLSAFIAQICIDNNINGHYVEPYAGGASVALFLLLERYVSKITINDKDKSIYAFWYSVINHTDELCGRIETCDLTIENWLLQKIVQKNKENVPLIDLGFSTLFLNRTNRSGIINAGVIGGLEQMGNDKMDCRFNKQEIIRRIKEISQRKQDIQLFNIDAVELIDIIENQSKNENVIFYFDPPYYLKASSLYMSHYKNDDHIKVSERIKKIANIQWIVSYDNAPEINELYEGCKKKEYSFKHHAYKTRIGNEILFFSDNLIQPTIDNWNPLLFKFSKSKNNTKKIAYKVVKQLT